MDNSADNGSAVIEVDGLHRSYGRFEAVRGVSFQVRRGELFALLGTNGAGKTSTIEVLEGLHRPTGGRVRVFGRDPWADRADVRPRTGVMLQEGGFSGGLTVGETLDFWSRLTPRPRPTGEALEIVGLTARTGVAVEQLSGGERRRLDLALAVLGRPELLFLDEPTAGMDPPARRRTREVIRELMGEGATVVLTTHNLEDAEALADRLVIMNAGRIAHEGVPEDVVEALPSRITFRLPAGTAVTDLPDLPGASPDVEGPRVTYRSREMQAHVTRLLAWADAAGVTLAGFAARPASLEDVFLDVADHGVDHGADDHNTIKAVA